MDMLRTGGSSAAMGEWIMGRSEAALGPCTLRAVSIWLTCDRHRHSRRSMRTAY
jgi:hypothetical protein